nr:bifunctional diaminohydroxyphosphoribosylaminopyrimidine deaminase/5-amino-6-(5-phosphoribosylamino)uracil reductase RibD [Burkholderiaceae bacterium]
MALDDTDTQRLHECLDLARQSVGLCDPNPRVGCIIARADGQRVASGFTQAAGAAHAEAAALDAARSIGSDLRGAAAWVSLEPCAHHGRTPPCCDALIDAGVGRVVVATRDPNPLVAGQGIARLRAAGITVDLADG